MITIIGAAKYSINNGFEMAFEVTYSDGTKVRAVRGNGMIRKEWLKGDEWVRSGKAYVVVANKKRQAERLVQTVVDWLAE